VVLGPIADQVAGDIREHLALTADAPLVVPNVAAVRSALESRLADASQAERVLAAIGGAGNLRDVEGANGRLLLSIADPARLDGAVLATITRGVAQPVPGSVHLLMAGDTRPLAARIQALAGVR